MMMAGSLFDQHEVRLFCMLLCSDLSIAHCKNVCSVDCVLKEAVCQCKNVFHKNKLSCRDGAL